MYRHQKDRREKIDVLNPKAVLDPRKSSREINRLVSEDSTFGWEARDASSTARSWNLTPRTGSSLFGRRGLEITQTHTLRPHHPGGVILSHALVVPPWERNVAPRMLLRLFCAHSALGGMSSRFDMDPVMRAEPLARVTRRVTSRGICFPSLGQHIPPRTHAAHRHLRRHRSPHETDPGTENCAIDSPSWPS